MKLKQKRTWMSLGPALKAFRKEVGLSGAEMGKRMGWAQSNVSRIERGVTDTRWGTVVKYLEAAGLKGHLVVAVRSEDGVETEHWVEI